MTVALDHLLTRSATLLLRSPDAEDAWGDPSYEVVEQSVRCELQQSSSGEDREGGLMQSRFRVWLPAGAPVDGWDAIELDGAVYELEGEPSAVWNPLTSSVHHLEAEAVRTR